jgi:hypothetical protein
MPVKTWKLVDQDSKLPLQAQLPIGALDVPGLGKASITKRTLSGGLAEGVVSIEINNGKLQLDVLPTLSGQRTFLPR